MQRFLRIVICVAMTICGSTLAQASTVATSRDNDQVAAFAKLYGVVRYFYPGDASQTLDWDRLAVAGVSDASHARSSTELRARLTALFAPLGPGIDIVEDYAPFPPALPAHDGGSEALVAWRYLGFTTANNPTYIAARTGRHREPPFVALSTLLKADALRGRTIRLRGSLAALDASTTKGLGLWLRIDGNDKAPSFFENTEDRQVHDRDWHAYVIKAPVDQQASQLVFGFTMSLHDDAKDPAAGLRDFVLEVSDGHGGWTAVPIPSLMSAASGKSGWGLSEAGRYHDSASSASWQSTGAGTPYLRIERRGGSMDDAPFDVPAVAGRNITFALGEGLQARVALTLTDAQARLAPDRAAALTALKARLAATADPAVTVGSRAAREADVVVAWNVFRHFYPYADAIHIDWNPMLLRALGDANGANSRTDQKHVLQRLLAPLQDAHGTVYDSHDPHRSSLPVTLAPVAGQWLVAASAIPDLAPVGAVVTRLDGTPMPQARIDAEARTSGQPSSRSWKALQDLQWGATGATRTFEWEQADGSRQVVALKYNEKSPPPLERPAPIAELRPGIWYVDVARVDEPMFDAHLDQLARAHAVIYDVRGYPKDFNLSKAIPAHLLKHAEHARWMHIPRYTGPFGEHAGYLDLGWDIVPQAPHFTSRAIFLADGGTISQAEAIMGYVQDDKLGTIVGSTTRGVDGNITSFTVPTGFGIVFTGMKVTHHDGTSRYQALGTPPDIRLAPTIRGIRSKRDEVLERALSIATSTP